MVTVTNVKYIFCFLKRWPSDNDHHHHHHHHHHLHMNGGSSGKHSLSSDDSHEPRKSDLRTQLAYQMTGTSHKIMRRPAFPVRPANIKPSTPSVMVRPQVSSLYTHS